MRDFCGMIRPDVLRAAQNELERKGPRATWPLYWAKYQLLAAEKDWLVHYDAYAAKWPRLMAEPDFAPPPSANAEQASSQATALWRGRWLRDHTDAPKEGPLARRALDLTGGSGIDCWGLEHAGFSVTAVEPDAHLVELLRWNGQRLGRTVISGSAENQSFEHDAFDWVFVDPSRREATGRVALSDLGQPDPKINLRSWQHWGQQVALKLSPMLDANEVARWFPEAEELCYVSIRREVKELVVRIPRQKKHEAQVVAVSIDEDGRELLRWTTDRSALPTRASEVQTFLFDPDPALAASGGAASWAAAHGLQSLHPDSRLYTAEVRHELPGCRVFRVDSIHAVPPRDLGSASVVARAFPERADVLRRRLRLAEDSERFLFATRLAGSPAHVYIVATRLA
ncbi:MAG: hypothetical protein RL429_430 [Bacteroidota bacterium]|jgi:hypothetical protein